MLSVVRIDVFFLIGRRSLADPPFLLSRSLRRCAMSCCLSCSERLFAVLVVVLSPPARRRRTAAGAARRPPPPPPSPGPLRSMRCTSAVANSRLGRDIVGDDLDDRALLALLGLPAALLEPAGHDDARALLQRRGDVLGELPPAHDVEEARALLPLVGLLVAPRTVDGDAEGRGRDPARRCSASRGRG